jgi:Holliday junction resolvase-like predicted endonuclease
MNGQPPRSTFLHPSANNISGHKSTKQTKLKRLIYTATMYNCSRCPRRFLHARLDMIIKAKDGVTYNIMLDFKSLCPTSNANKHA